MASRWAVPPGEELQGESAPPGGGADDLQRRARARVEQAFYEVFVAEPTRHCSIWETGFCSCVRKAEAAPGSDARSTENGPRPRPTEEAPAQLDIWDFMSVK